MNKRRLRIRAVIFDMDGVITNTMPYHFRAWQKIFNDHGLTIPAFEVYRREGQKGLDSVLEIFSVHGCRISVPRAKGLLRKKERLLKRIVKKRFIPGSRTLIKELDAHGCKLALVTGTSRHEVREILPKNIYQLFDVIVCGCDVQNGKPHPEPYQMAIRKLGIKKRDSVVIENAPFGIRSAKRAGLMCFALETSLPAKYLAGADAVFHSIKHLKHQIDFYVQNQP